MITEDDLSQVLREMADDAPDRCASFSPHPDASRRRGLAATVTAVLVAATVLAVAVSTAVTGRGDPSARHDAGTSSGPGRTASASVPLATGLTSVQRRHLTSLALESARLNGERHPTAWAVHTTYVKLNASFPSFFVGMPARDPRTQRTPAATSPIWIVWTRGDFDGGYYAMADLVDGVTGKGLAGTFDVDTGYGLSAYQLAPLGTVVRLL